MRRSSRRLLTSTDTASQSPLTLINKAAVGHRGQLARVSLIAALAGFSEALVLVIIARLAFALAGGDKTVHISVGPIDERLSVPALIGIALALVAVRGFLQVLQAHIGTKVFVAVYVSARRRVLNSYLGASWSLQAAERTGQLQELMTTFSMNAASTAAAMSLIVVSLVSLLTYVITALFINPIAAAVVASAFLVSALALQPVRRHVRARARDAAEANLAFATSVTEVADTIQEIRVFGVEREVGAEAEQRIADAGALDQRARVLGQVAPAVYQTMALGLIVVAIAAVYASGTDRLASLGGIVLIMIRSLSYGQQLQANYQMLFTTAPFLEKLEDELARYRAAGQPMGGDPVDRVGDLELSGVSYEYQSGRPVLDNVSLCVRAGEIIGIVGPSGSGKSTLVQILLRLRSPTTGRYLVAGRDVRDLALQGWYKRVSFVPQDARLLAGTVADNIRFFREGVDAASIERAAKLANLHDEIERMPAGYHTTVGERGSALSGGQRQRLSIARALAEEPDLIVFDEPTSSLDVRSEALIRETLRDLAPAATVVIIAHRLSTLEMCDRIMVILDGKLEGFDTPKRLEASNPFYREALELSGLR